MTGRLQLIEQRLLAIDPAGFQNLCDAYLILSRKDLRSYNRTGSQLGKQKTIPGTPDSLIRLASNKIAYIEFTTITDSIVKKIISDIDKCVAAVKINPEENVVLGIIIFFNSRLNPSEESEIQIYARNIRIDLELIGIDTLSLEILSKYFILSRDFLSIPLETGQILPINRFIQEYNNKANQLSTPLDNIFFHREKELNEIIEYLQSEDLLLLSGAPGVGKTKLGIEASLRFIEKNPSFEPFVISNKNVDLFDDLKIQLMENKDYLLLVDDANRQISNLSQLLGVFKGAVNGKIKIILTIRNYAISEVTRSIMEYKYQIINIQKFTDEEIVEILKSDSFGIFNPNYHKKIVEISDGNIRLAIMSARLANEKQTDFLWGDVSDLFDAYFNNFLNDADIFENKNLLKVLGLLSFFFTLNRLDKEFVSNLLKLFDIDYYSFNESIDDLEKKELVEIKYNHVKVSEQVMATYFFYKVFIKDELLSFKTLLFCFFEEWKTRFKDSIIPANNSFGYDNVQGKINANLDEYLSSIYSDEIKVLAFLDLFWFYKPAATLDYFYTKIKLLPEPTNPIYIAQYETNDFVFSKDETIDFISKYFDHPTEWFLQAITLGFEYIRKKPAHLPELIRRIREHLLFDQTDEKYNFKRQSDFIDLLILNLFEKHTHYIISFFALAETFLQHTYQITHAFRKNKIEWYDYQLPFYDITKEIRNKLWNALFDNFSIYPENILEVLLKFKPIHQKLIPEIIEFDLSLLIPFIRENFNPNIFKHAYYVQELNYWFDKEERILDRSYRLLKYSFLTEEYIDFRKLEWNRLKDKEDYDFDNYQEYDYLKTEEIKNGFIFSTVQEFDKLFTAIENYLSVRKNDYSSISQSIDIIIEANFILNHDLGFKLLQSILTKETRDFPLLPKTLLAIEKQSKKWSVNLWHVLSTWENKNKNFWLLNFFCYLPDKYIDKNYARKLISLVQRIEKYAYLNIENYARFRKADHKLIKQILEIISEKNKNGNDTIIFSESVFSTHLEYFESDYNLITLTYFQQLRFNQSLIFDHRGYGFCNIFNAYPQFLLDYIENFYSGYDLSSRESDPDISFIWDSESHYELIESACNILSDKKIYLRTGDHIICNFFKHLNEQQKSNTISFLNKYIGNNSKNVARIDMIFMAIRTCLNDKYDELFLFYLSINPDLNNFKEIDWAGPVGAQVGHANFGELYARKWEKILELVNKSTDKLAIIPIQNYLKSKISNYYIWAENERERNFLTPDY